MKKIGRNKLVLWIAIILMVVSMIGAGSIQSSGGKVEVTDVRWENSYGMTVTGLLLKPKTATAENPAPAIVCSHGFLNNKEMQDLNFVELARRGYVVLAIDMVSHGNSDIGSGVPQMMNCVHEGVQFLCDIDYVQNTQIGVTGHSFGGLNCNIATSLDNLNETPHIAAVLVNSMDPTYVDSEGNYTNVYGTRHAGVIAGMYDEFGFNTVDAAGNPIAKPDYIHSPSAQSFLYYGVDPSGLPEREHDVVYHDEVDGVACMRVIYTPEITHPWSHFSQRSTVATINFFQEAIPAPNPIAATNQVWQIKVVFNVLGLLGFAMFIASSTIALVDTKPFAVLKAEAAPAPVVLNKKGKIWFWVSLLICGVYGAASYLPVMKLANAANFSPTLLGQSAPFGISVWAAGCAVVSIICMIIGSKLGGENPLKGCLKLSGAKILKTLLLAVTVAGASFAWVFIADYFFHVDFRIWTLAAKAFNAQILLISIPYMLLLCIFYVTSSVAVNCFNFNTVGKKEWINTVIVAASTLIAVVIPVVMQYTYFKANGFLLWSEDQTHLMIVWLYPLFGMLPASAVIARYVFKGTKNPYLPGIINAIIIALMSCANTSSFL